MTNGKRVVRVVSGGPPKNRTIPVASAAGLRLSKLLSIAEQSHGEKSDGNKHSSGAVAVDSDDSKKNRQLSSS